MTRETCPELKRLLSEWAVLDRLYREMADSVVREAILARREVLRGQIAALAADAAADERSAA